VGEVIAYAEVVRARRARTARAVHAASRWIIAQSVKSARAALIAAPMDERALHAARLRKLVELEAYAAAIG
jgi:hypothetical protein